VKFYIGMLSYWEENKRMREWLLHGLREGKARAAKAEMSGSNNARWRRLFGQGNGEKALQKKKNRGELERSGGVKRSENGGRMSLSMSQETKER